MTEINYIDLTCLKESKKYQKIVSKISKYTKPYLLLSVCLTSTAFYYYRSEIQKEQIFGFTHRCSCPVQGGWADGLDPLLLKIRCQIDLVQGYFE